MICHCDACNYTFDASVLHGKDNIPTRCPDCGKKTVGYKVPAVRAASEEEVAEYIENQRLVMEELSEQLNRDSV